MAQRGEVRETAVHRQVGGKADEEAGCPECERMRARIFELKTILDGTLQGVADLVLRYVIPNYIAPELRIRKDVGKETRFREMFRPVSID